MYSYPDDAFDWIQSGREKFSPRTETDWTGVPVSGLITAQFEAYAKILHRIEATYKNIDNPLTDRESESLKIPKCKELRSVVESLRAERLGPRVRWRTLAHLLRVPFQAEICREWFRTTMKEPGCWPRLLVGPEEGFLNDEELIEVVSILAPFTSNQDCFFRFSEMATNKPLLFHGILDELRGFLADEKYRVTPEYWWPADRTWCLCSDYDLAFTFVGGSKELISSLRASSILETLEVTPQTRVDYLAPIPK